MTHLIQANLIHNRIISDNSNQINNEFDIIEQKTSPLLNFSPEQANFTNQCSDLLKKIRTDILSDPLLSYIDIEIGISGGAIRDLLAGQVHNIKDIDILVSPILTKKDSSNTFSLDIMEKIKKNCEQLNLVFNKNDPIIENKSLLLLKDKENESDQFCYDTEYFFLLFKYVVNKHFSVYSDFGQQNFIPENTSAENAHYEPTGIHGVLKLKDNSIAYDIDLILITSPILTFTEYMFDYDICKVIYYEKEYAWEHSYTTPEHSGSFYLFPSFIHNIEQKKITYNTKKFNNEQIERSLYHHLGRIIKKYPDYSVELLNSTEEQQTLLNNALLYHKLQGLEISTKTNKSKKI